MPSAARRLLADRATWKTVQGRRIRRLFRTYLAQLDAENAVHQAAALRAAELMVAAEDMRARLLAGDVSAEEAVTRLENAARRAEDDLKKLIPKPMSYWQRRQLEREDDDAEEG